MTYPRRKSRFSLLHFSQLQLKNALKPKRKHLPLNISRQELVQEINKHRTKYIRERKSVGQRLQYLVQREKNLILKIKKVDRETTDGRA